MTTTDLRLWTVDEYHRMIQAKILTTDDMVELIEGQILQMSPQNPPHAATTQRTWKYLSRLLIDKADLRVQLPITLCPTSEPEPDIAVVRFDSRDYLDSHPTADDIFLLLEVADNTLNKDCNQKARTYAKAKIADYWVLDVNRHQIYVFRKPGNTNYQQKAILGENATLSPLAFPEIEVEVKQLFP